MKTLALYFLLGCAWCALLIGVDQARPHITRRAVREVLQVLLGGVALFAVGYALLCGLFLL